MKMLDIVTQLKLILPRYTDKFTSIIPIYSIDSTNNITIINTNGEHDLLTGDEVILSGYSVSTYISNVSQDGLIFTFTTAIDHDLTENWQETIDLSGFDSTSWNNTFNIDSVPNRRTFKIQSTNTIPSLTGNENILENRMDGVNGHYAVTVIDSTTLRITDYILEGTYSGGSLNTFPRIAGMVDLTRAHEHYTEQDTEDLWMYVTMNDANVSKDDNTYNDGRVDSFINSETRMQLVDGFMVYVYANTSNDIGAQVTVDICRDELLGPILKCVHGMRFDSGLLLTESIFKTIFVGHGTAYYNKAYYVHSFGFEVSMEVLEQDGVEPINTRAYRDTKYNKTVGTEIMTVTIDQDDEPLDRS